MPVGVSGLLILLLEFLVKGLSECIEPSIEPVHPYRTQIRVSGVGHREVRHEWGVLSTASAAFSQTEGNIVNALIIIINQGYRIRYFVGRIYSYDMTYDEYEIRYRF